MKRKISVIVPIYNVEKFLKKCIDSIINQTYKNIEIILVDDGSTDGSGKICDDAKEKHKNVVVIHKKNGGLSSARNAGIDASTGDYLSFIDSDDFIDLEMYEVMIESIERTGKDIASCGRIVDIYGTHSNIEFCLNKELIYNKKDAIKQILNFNDIDVSACDKIYKKKLFKNIRYPEGKISEDAAVIFELVNSSNGIVHVGKPFYHYVFRKKSISKSCYSVKNLDILTNLKNTQKFIEDNYNEFIDDFKVYSCITAGAQLILLNSDHNAKKRFATEHKLLKNYFKEGYRKTLKCNNLNKKKKFELFCVRHKILWLYNLLKNIYQVKYILKQNNIGVKR